MAELNINTEDIAVALRKNLEDFKPGFETAQVGRITEVGDGTPRVSGLPNAGQRAARVRERRRGPGPEPRRGVDRRRLLGEAAEVKEGETVKATGRILEYRWATACSGRVVMPWATRSTAPAG